MSSPSKVRIATRESALALWQANHVAERLRLAHPGLEVDLVPMTTRGDQEIDRPLAAIGGKGLFLKELEIALAENRADIAVHSMKDVPMELEPGFTIAAILEREDPFDAFVSNHYDSLASLPHGARVGTSSLRRQAQLRAMRPDLELVDLRGNVNTRLRKLDEGQYDAIVLAIAGLKRLGFEPRVHARLELPEFVPAVAQGAIGIECRDDNDAMASLAAILGDAETTVCVRAERAMNNSLHGSCQVPVAGHARLIGGGRMCIVGLVGDAGSGRLVRAEYEGDVAANEALGRSVAEALLGLGAREMLG